MGEGGERNQKSEIREENSKLIRKRRDKKGREEKMERKKGKRKKKEKKVKTFQVKKLVKKFRLRHSLEACYGEENSAKKI